MTQRPLYDPNHMGLLQAVWGTGYLSPGGPEEVARILGGLDLSGRSVLDIGCGAGAITVALARDHGAGEVVGIDVEAEVCRAASASVAAAGLEARVAIRHVAPGALPFERARFDVVFSKDSIVHIPDKEALAHEAFRVLRPGGWFLASDWLTSHDGPPSAPMRRYLELEDLDFAMASPARYRRALEGAGFGEVALLDRNPWYRTQARQELALLEGTARADLEQRFGHALVEASIEAWRAMVGVLESGEHCPHHLRARREEPVPVK
ncbi:MAG: methyltransferase domain-containing protein [Pseudomonadota bacterium]